MPTLEGLFRYADIEDVFEDRETVQIAFTVRESRNRFAVEGESLMAALTMAEQIVRKDQTLERLRDEGLTDEDIERITDGRTAGDLIDEAWQRGWMARAQEEELETERLAHELYIASQQPAMAMAGEPRTDGMLSVSILAADGELEHVIDPDKVGIPIILQVPGRIVLS